MDKTTTTTNSGSSNTTTTTTSGPATTTTTTSGGTSKTENSVNNNTGSNMNLNGSSSNSNNNNNNNNSGANGNSLQQQQEAVKTFEHLLRKSQRLFVGLRDLPQFGRQWQPFFQKTFELYTKLWKHQQLYRSILEDKAKYGLKRCEIGEIASKIGQLYYHYYLRTSDTNYLNESYIFYEAIRLRAYFKDVSADTKMPDMMVKQLRYYARFIVVCLLLNRKKVVLELVEELFKHVKDYQKVYKPNDSHEWNLVIQEIFSFLQADQCISFSDINTHLHISHRLSAQQQLQLLPPTVESISILQQAILVGNHQNQIKFSEITLDMFRMTQSLEYETPDLKDPSDKQQVELSSSKKKNPHKYLLYRPTITQLLLFLSNSSKELGENKALLLYLSVDGVKNSQENNNGPYSHALSMNSQKHQTPTQQLANKTNLPPSSAPTTTPSPSSTTTNPSSSEPTTTDNSVPIDNNFYSSINSDGVKIDALYPMDLIPYCRKPFFLIIDSQSSHIFKDILPPFNQPFISLLSPVATPKKIINNNKRNSAFGNLFTFFLHDPLGAFCDLTSCNKIISKNLASYQSIVQSAMVNIAKLLFETPNLHHSFNFFILDDFLRQFIIRFIFCHAVFHLHKEFQENNSIYQVSSNPALPSSILLNQSVLNSVLQLASALNATDQFITKKNNNDNNNNTTALQNLTLNE